LPLLLLLQVSAVAGAVSLGFMSQTMQAAVLSVVTAL
jgi:hypothetical protein